MYAWSGGVRVALGGKDGLVWAKSTTAGIVGGATGAFAQSFTWNDLGLLANETYPAKTGTNPAPCRTLTNGYSNGLLTQVNEGAMHKFLEMWHRGVGWREE